MTREEREKLFPDEEPNEGGFYHDSVTNAEGELAVSTPNAVALFVPDGYRFHTKSEVTAFVNDEITKLGDEHSFLRIYTRAKEIELFVKEILARTKTKAIEGAYSLTGGAMGKAEHHGAEVQVRNVRNTYEYTDTVQKMETELEHIQTEINIQTASLQQQATELQESIAARKKYEEATQVVADKAKITKMGGVSLAITFKK